MKYFTTFLVLFSISNFCLGKDVPRLTSPVMDQAGLLSPRVEKALSDALFNVKRQTGNEISVLTVSSLEGETIEGYSLKVADSWKLGSKGKDNGALLLIAIDDKKMRIEVGRGLEGNLPDITSGRIIRSITKYFKRGHFESGIIFGVSEMVKNTGGTLEGAPKVRNRRSGRSKMTLVMLAFFFILSLFGRGRGLLAGMVLGSVVGGSSRRGGGSFGGGGFGGGGGSFGGGGASGSW